MWGRRFRYKSYQARLCWGSTAPWLHTLICSTYCLKKNDQHIVKPFCRICSNCLCFYCYPSVAVQLVLTSSHLCFLILFSNGKIHPLTYIHHTSTYQASLCKLMEYWWTDVLFVFFFFPFWQSYDERRFWCPRLISCSLSPAINTLQAQAKENEIRVISLILS